MGVLQCIDLARENHDLSINLDSVSQVVHNMKYNCAHIDKGSVLSFKFHLNQIFKMDLVLNVCDVYSGSKLDTVFTTEVNGTKVLNAYREKDWSFHNVLCTIPLNELRCGENEVKIYLEDSSITALFLRNVTLFLEREGRKDAVGLDLSTHSPAIGFSIVKAESFYYKQDLKSWSLSTLGAIMESHFYLGDAQDVRIGLELCSGISSGIIDSPIDILVNGTILVEAFDPKFWGFRDYFFAVSANKLNAGRNVIQVCLNKGSTCMFVRRIMIAEKEG